MNASTQSPQPWLSPWPADGLEPVPRCPVCDDARREPLYPDLVDRVFRVAPGHWQLWSCQGCGSAYLDPRPTPETIHLAYSAYYTHGEPEGRDDYAGLSPFRKLRRRLVNGYTNWRYGTKAQPASRLGVPIALAAPGLKRVLDRQYRHLPRPPRRGGRLLDLGCGDGYFLRLAQSCGWQVKGVDPDPQAGAKRLGLTVHSGGIECLDGQGERFDVITLNHVIEHLHRPLDVLRRCHALLSPGGQLWLETPNIRALGHGRYKAHWRGLEPPRHLVLFSGRSLREALAQAGFSRIRSRSRPDPSLDMFRQSQALELDASPYRDPRATQPRVGSARRAARLSAVRRALSPSRREFLTVTAMKQ